MSALISLRGVSMVFNEQTAVDNLSLSVERGEVLALLGQTGAGKSTVLNLILGQIRPTAGTVMVHGHDPYADSDALRGKMAVSFQTDRLLPWRNALRNVELGLEILHRRREERSTLAADWLTRVKLDHVHHGKYPHQLSGGMRQRVSSGAGAGNRSRSRSARRELQPARPGDIERASPRFSVSCKGISEDLLADYASHR